MPMILLQRSRRGELTAQPAPGSRRLCKSPVAGVAYVSVTCNQKAQVGDGGVAHNVGRHNC